MHENCGLIIYIMMLSETDMRSILGIVPKFRPLLDIYYITTFLTPQIQMKMTVRSIMLNAVDECPTNNHLDVRTLNERAWQD